MNSKTVVIVLAPGFEETEAIGTADVLKRIFKRDPSLPDISQYSVPKPKPIIIPG